MTENVEKSVRQQVFSTLRSMLDTDMRFSEGRCGKVLPLATATYQENLPSHYTRDYHESRVGISNYIYFHNYKLVII